MLRLLYQDVLVELTWLVQSSTAREQSRFRHFVQIQEIMYNPKVVAHSVQDAALGDGEGCLSVDRDVPGYVVRHARVTVEYFNKEGEKQRVKLRGYNSIVVQHEIDHTNGIMFYDRINKDNPFAIKDGLLIIE